MTMRVPFWVKEVCMPIFKMILVFAPWLAFLVIAQGSLLRLEIGLAVALGLSMIMGLARIHRGVILWAGLLFFTYSAVAVVLYHNTWTIRYMGVLASAILAISTWFGVIIGKPFTLDYARAQVDSSVWNDPGFIRSNVIVTSAWGLVFILNAVLALGKSYHFILPELGYEIISYALLISTAFFTSWYTKIARVKREKKRE